MRRGGYRVVPLEHAGDDGDGGGSDDDAAAEPLETELGREEEAIAALNTGDQAAELLPPAAASAPPPAPRSRMLIYVLLMTANAVCYADRASISVTIIPMSTPDECDLSKKAQGLVLSSFFIGYLCTQILGGWLAKRMGGKRVLLVAVVVWSAFTLATPAAARHGLWALVLARIGLGLGEGMSLPATHHLLSCWAPAAERTRATVFVTSGQVVGTVAGVLASPLAAYRWPLVFALFGALGMLWAALALFFMEEEPACRAAPMQRAERAERRALLALPGLLAVRPFAAIWVGHVAANFGWYVLLSWLPSYFHELGVSPAAVGYYAVVPYVTIFVCDNVWSWYLDRRIAGGLGLRDARVVSQSISFVGGGFWLVVITMLRRPGLWPAVALVSASMGLSSFTHSGLWANVIDIAPEGEAGYLLGVSNTMATLPGIFGNLLSGVVIDACGGCYDGLWGLTVASYLIGWVVFSSWCSGERL